MANNNRSVPGRGTPQAGGRQHSSVPRKAAALTPSDMTLADIAIPVYPDGARLNDVLMNRGFDPNLKQLGKGGFGEVFITTLRDANGIRIQVALKEMSSKGTVDERYIKNEIYALKKIRAPNIVGHVDSFVIGKNKFYVAMELCTGGTLHQRLKSWPKSQNDGFMEEPLIRAYFRQLAQGIYDIHRAGFAHRDIKLANILIDGQDRLKIADFGLTKKCYLEKPGDTAGEGEVRMIDDWAGTELYMAPEILRLQADMFAVGVVLFLLFFKRPPVDYRQPHEELVSDRVRRKNYSALKKRRYQWRPKVLDKLDANMRELVVDILEGLLDPNHMRRYSAHCTLKHAWFIADRFNKPPHVQHERSSSSKAKLPSHV